MNTWTEIAWLLEGLTRSLIVSACGIAAGLLIGVSAGAVRYSRIPILGSVVAIYINLFRCTPLIVQIFFLYNALPEVGIMLDPFQAGFTALALWGGAYQAEIVRANLRAVPHGEVQGARALGMSGWRAFVDVSLPRGLRAAIPGLTTTMLTQFRSSSFLVAIGYMELTFVANEIVSRTFEVFKVFALAALMYLLVCTAISYGSRTLERWVAIPGLGVSAR